VDAHLRFAIHDLPSTLVKLYVGITDYDWFKLHASKDFVEKSTSGAHLLRQICGANP